MYLSRHSFSENGLIFISSNILDVQQHLIAINFAAEYVLIHFVSEASKTSVLFPSKMKIKVISKWKYYNGTNSVFLPEV